MPRGSIIFCWFCFAVSTIQAQPPKLDAQLTTPYQRQIIVDFQPHPLFSVSYRARFLESIRSTLAPDMGDLGTITVTDLSSIPNGARQSLTQAFVETGFQALEQTKFRELSGISSEYLRLSLKGSTLHLESRRHDGDTGLCTPFVRTSETRDLQTAPRLAGLMLAKDFGVSGTVELKDKETETLQVRFRGGQLKGFSRWLHMNDVLLISEVFTQNNSALKSENPPAILAARPSEYTLLRVEAVHGDGSARCRVLTGYRTAFSYAKNLAGVRAMKVTTTQAPFSVRILDQNGQVPAANTPLLVQASDIDFPTRADTRYRLDYRNGIFESTRPLKNTACVTVTLGSTEGRRFPIAIYDTDHNKPIVIRYPLDTKLIARAEFEQKLDNWLGRVMSIYETQQSLSKEMTRLIIAGKNPQALERGVGGIAALEQLDQALTAEGEALKKQPHATDVELANRLNSGETRLKIQREARPAIQEKIEELRRSIGKLDDPAQFEKVFAAKELNNRIRSLIDAGEIPEALDTFDQLYDLTKQETIKERKAKLDAEWATKNEEHAKARKFSMKQWRDYSELKDFVSHVDQLNATTQLFVKLNDRLGLRNIVTSISQTYTKLKDILDRLDGKSEFDREEIKQLQKVNLALIKIEDEARESIRKIENPR